MKDFAAGGIGPIESPRRALAEIGLRYLQEPGKQIAIDEGLARPGDPAIRNKAGVILLAAEIYYLARQVDTVGELGRFLMQPRYALGLGGIYCAGVAAEPPKLSD